MTPVSASDFQSALDPGVLRALTKWPNVPHCYGWLRLDRRGRWRLQDDVLRHPRSTAFINRNYTVDERGCWFFQNGPQRVYVELDYAPWIYRFAGHSQLQTHTDSSVTTVTHVYVDSAGDMLLETEHGIGNLHDSDLSAALDYLVTPNGHAATDADIETNLTALQSGEPAALLFRWGADELKIEPVASDRLEQRFRFVRKPRPD